MKRLIWVPLVAVVAIACTLPVRAVAATPPCVLYVSPIGNDAWSGKLATANAAKSDGPLASLTAARDAIRRLKAAGPLMAPVEVHLRGGIYRPQEMLALEAQDSGTEQCPIAYVAFPGETPVISGGVPITGFRPWRGQIVCADLPDCLPPDTYFRSLFVVGQRAVRAVVPALDLLARAGVRSGEPDRGPAVRGRGAARLSPAADVAGAGAGVRTD